MTRRHYSAGLALPLVAILAAPAFAVKDGYAKFMGGTIKTIAEKAEGPIDLTNEKRLTFVPKNGALLEIPWGNVTQVEYGQKVARRWRSAILLNPLALLSKSRKHFVTLSYKDRDKMEQAVVLEFDGGDIRMVLASLKVRTNQAIIMQDDEAKKEMGGVVDRK